jgi:hypothetical protein
MRQLCTNVREEKARLPVFGGKGQLSGPFLLESLHSRDGAMNGSPLLSNGRAAVGLILGFD